MKAKLWIARDKNGELYLYNDEPVLGISGTLYIPSSNDIKGCMEIDKNSHPEITFENSPKQIEI